MKLKKKRNLKIIIAMIFSLMLTLSNNIVVKAGCGGLDPKDVYVPAKEDVIQDPMLNWVVRSSLSSILARPIITKELLEDPKLTDMQFDNLNHPEEFEKWPQDKPAYWISSLEGLQYAKYLKRVVIQNMSTTPFTLPTYFYKPERNTIGSLKPLSELTEIEILLLDQNGITDVSDLSKLTNVTVLSLKGNEIESVAALSKMTKLTSLSLDNNKINNVDILSNFKELTHLSLANNKINSIPDLSELKHINFLDIKNNDLKDINEISKLDSLSGLDISGNDNIKDIKALVNLTKLNKNITSLPSKFAGEHANLFAAIDVNKVIKKFNISKMTEKDLDTAKNAMEAYNKLTSPQKAYFESEMISLIKENINRVSAGQEPRYVEKYDRGERQPVLDHIEFKVVDKDGKPVEGVNFKRTFSLGTDNLVSDTKGVVRGNFSAEVLKDASGVKISLADDRYVTETKDITYRTTLDKRLYIINNTFATGFEDIKIVVYDKDTYVDKRSLKEAINKTLEVGSVYEYKQASYKVYLDALSVAKKALTDDSLSGTDIERITKNLNDAIKGLVKEDKLTAVRVKVVDKDGNIFARPFKLKVSINRIGVNGKYVNQGFVNEYTDPNTGYATVGIGSSVKSGDILVVGPCTDEAYNGIAKSLVIGETSEKTLYIEKINSKAASKLDEKQTIEVYPLSNATGPNIVKPGYSALKDIIDNFSKLETTLYTPNSYNFYSGVIKEVSEAVAGKQLTQEKYNELYKRVKEAQDKLVKRADVFDLVYAIDNPEDDSFYTPNSYIQYKEVLDEAKAVAANLNAGQKEVDDMLAKVNKAKNDLVKKADKKELNNNYKEAKTIVDTGKDVVVMGYSDLEQVLDKAVKVINDDNASNIEVDAINKALVMSMNNIVVHKAVSISVNKDKLNNLISKIPSTYTLNKYTAESLKSLNDTVEKVKTEVVNNDDASQAEVDKAYSTIQRKIRELQTIKGVKPVLSEGEKNKEGNTSVKVIVVDENNNPIAGESISLIYMNGDKKEYRGTAKTDSNGLFSWMSLSKDKELYVVYDGKNYIDKGVDAANPSSVKLGLDIVKEQNPWNPFMTTEVAKLKTVNGQPISADGNIYLTLYKLPDKTYLNDLIEVVQDIADNKELYKNIPEDISVKLTEAGSLVTSSVVIQEDINSMIEKLEQIVFQADKKTISLENRQLLKSLLDAAKLITAKEYPIGYEKYNDQIRAGYGMLNKLGVTDEDVIRQIEAINEAKIALSKSLVVKDKDAGDIVKKIIYTKVEDNESPVIYSTGDLDSLTGVYFNNKLVDPKNYTTERGSTILRFAPSFLDNQPVGTYKVALEYYGLASANVDLEIRELSNNNDNHNNDNNQGHLGNKDNGASSAKANNSNNNMSGKKAINNMAKVKVTDTSDKMNLVFFTILIVISSLLMVVLYRFKKDKVSK